MHANILSTYSTSAIIPNPSADTLQSALVVLTNNGFAIRARDEYSATLSGPGLNSTRQNPLLGASEIRLAREGNQLRLDAVLGGAERLQKFILSIPWFTGLGAATLLGFLGVLFGVLFGAGFGVPGASGWLWLCVTIGAGAISAFPWMFISPWLSSKIRVSTEEALKKLVNNAVQL